MSSFSARYRNILLGSSTGALIGMLFGPVGAIFGATIGLATGSVFHHFTD